MVKKEIHLVAEILRIRDEERVDEFDLFPVAPSGAGGQENNDYYYHLHSSEMEIFRHGLLSENRE